MIPWVFWKSVWEVVRGQNESEAGERRTVPPKRTNFVLATDIPNGERNVLVFDRLDVEACIGSAALVHGRVTERGVAHRWLGLS